MGGNHLTQQTWHWYPYKGLPARLVLGWPLGMWILGRFPPFADKNVSLCLFVKTMWLKLNTSVTSPHKNWALTLMSFPGRQYFTRVVITQCWMTYGHPVGLHWEHEPGFLRLCAESLSYCHNKSQLWGGLYAGFVSPPSKSSNLWGGLETPDTGMLDQTVVPLFGDNEHY